MKLNRSIWIREVKCESLSGPTDWIPLYMIVPLPPINLFIYSKTGADDLKTKLKLSRLQLDFIEKLSKFLVSPLPCLVTFFTTKSISNFYQMNLIMPREISDINDVGLNISESIS